MKILLPLLILFSSCKAFGPFDVAKKYQKNYFKNSFESIYGDTSVARDAHEYFARSTYYILLNEEIDHKKKTARVRVLIDTVNDPRVKYFLFGDKYKKDLQSAHGLIKSYKKIGRGLASKTLKIPVVYKLKLVNSDWKIIDVKIESSLL